MGMELSRALAGVRSFGKNFINYWALSAVRKTRLHADVDQTTLSAASWTHLYVCRFLSILKLPHLVSPNGTVGNNV